MFELALQDASGTTLVPHTELIEAVARIHDELKLKDHEEAFAALVDFLNDTGKLSSANAAKVQAIVDALGGAQELLARTRTLLQGFGIALAANARPLMKSLADLAREVGEKTYPLFRAGAAAGAGAGDVTLSIGAASDAVLELQTYDAAHGVEVGFTIPPGRAVQRVGVNGALHVRGDARGQLGSATVQAGGGVSGSSTLDFYFQFPESTALVTALVGVAGQIGAPWQLEAAMSRLQPVTADGGCSGFRRIHLLGEGSLDFSGSISVGQGWKYEANVGVDGRPGAVGLDVGAGLTLSASIRHSGLFEISVEKDATGVPIIDVRQTGSAAIRAP